jgi:lipoate-protein ligase A
MDRWLFLDSAPAGGAENMALDELLLDRAERACGAPVLRLYSFDPPAITFGRNQDPADILDLDAVSADGLDCVRRITGGRALLHEGELTYCVAAPRDSARFSSRPGETYLRISEAVSAAIRSLAVDAEVSRGREPARASGTPPPCLATTARYEITVHGRKIAGSAQRTTAAAFLQHGSILVRPGSSRIVKYLRGARPPLEDRVTSIEGELARVVDDGVVRAAIAGAFARVFDVRWEPLRLSKRDADEIAARAAEKRREMDARLAGEVCSP